MISRRVVETEVTDQEPSYNRQASDDSEENGCLGKMFFWMFFFVGWILISQVGGFFIPPMWLLLTMIFYPDFRKTMFF